MFDRFKPTEGGLREPLYEVVESCFPILLPLFDALSKHNTAGDLSFPS